MEGRDGEERKKEGGRMGEKRKTDGGRRERGLGRREGGMEGKLEGEGRMDGGR